MTTTTATTTPTTTVAPDYRHLIAQLTAKLTALGDGRDARSDNEKATYFATRDATQRTITALMNAPADLARAGTRLADAEADRDAWLAMQAELTSEIATFADWRLAGGARERDSEYERQRDYHRRLERLHRGTLYRAPGETFGTLDYLEQRIGELTTKLDAIRARLDAAVGDAGALLAQATTS